MALLLFFEAECRQVQPLFEYVLILAPAFRKSHFTMSNMLRYVADRMTDRPAMSRVLTNLPISSLVIAFTHSSAQVIRFLCTSNNITVLPFLSVSSGRAPEASKALKASNLNRTTA